MIVHVRKVDGEREWDHVVHVNIFLLTVVLHVNEQLVLGGQRLVALNVVNNLLVAKLAKPLEIDAITEGLPLEIEQVRRIDCLLPARKDVIGILGILVIAHVRSGSLLRLISGRVRSRRV